MDKTYVFDNAEGGCGNSGMMGLIASLCNQRGLDPNMVAAMMNNRNGDGFGNSAWWIIILLIFGWGGFGNGFGGGFGGRGCAQGLADLGNLVNNDAGRELLMQAIHGNGNAISQLASTVHCDTNALNAAIQNVQQSICQLGNTVGLGQQQIINAIQSGNASLASQLASCCCENRLAICNQTNVLQSAINGVATGMERGFAATNYAFADQTCQIKQAIAEQTNVINDKFCQLEMREMQNKIDALREQNSQLALAASQQAQTANIVAQLQPVARPAYLVANPNACGCGNYGYYPYGNNGCCNNGCNNNGCGCC